MSRITCLIWQFTDRLNFDLTSDKPVSLFSSVGQGLRPLRPTATSRISQKLSKIAASLLGVHSLAEILGWLIRQHFRGNLTFRSILEAYGNITQNHYGQNWRPLRALLHLILLTLGFHFWAGLRGLHFAVGLFCRKSLFSQPQRPKVELLLGISHFYLPQTP